MEFKEYREVGQVMETCDRCSSFCLKVKELLLEQRKKSGAPIYFGAPHKIYFFIE